MTSTQNKTEQLLPPEAMNYTGTSRRILEVALSRFSENGYRATTMREIAAELNIKAASIYEHFQSKDAILNALNEIGFSYLSAQMADALSSSEGRQEQLKALVKAWVMAFATYPKLAIVLLNERPKVEGKPYLFLERSHTRLALIIIDIMIKGVSEGIFANQNIVAAAGATLSMCVRVPFWFQESAHYTIEKLAEDYGEFALAIMRVPLKHPLIKIEKPG